jgi:uncharacterized membrane protein YhaH (DUF805 family)
MRERLNDAWRSVLDSTTGMMRFRGRSRIVDVFYLWIAMVLVQLIALALITPLAWDVGWWVGATVKTLVCLPFIALFCRRLHDQGLSGWFTPIILPLPAVGLYQSYRATFAVLNPQWLTERSFVQGLELCMMVLALTFLILLLRPGQKGANRYGPDPREAADQASSARVAASTSS